MLALLAACGGPTAAAPQQGEPFSPLMPSQGRGDLPAPDADLGTVAPGRSATATLSGTASVGFEAPGETALVAALDCSACTGPVEVTSPGAGTTWGTAAAPLTGQFLVDLSNAVVPDRVQVSADGDWTLTLSSPEDLPESGGPQSGTGPVVLRMADEGKHVRVEATSAGTGDDIHGRLVSAVGDDPMSLAVGADAELDQVYPVPMPGLVALDTDGSWTVTVTP
ncbi:hypothetical protein Cde04nite_09490 [Cellulomonas denverensis]|nr:hypothetical protein Cde04nite_09490 [Cellulomonas denverensis]